MLVVYPPKAVDLKFCSSSAPPGGSKCMVSVFSRSSGLAPSCPDLCEGTFHDMSSRQTLSDPKHGCHGATPISE